MENEYGISKNICKEAFDWDLDDNKNKIKKKKSQNKEVKNDFIFFYIQFILNNNIIKI